MCSSDLGSASTGVLVAVTTIVSKKYSGVFSAANAVVPHTTLVLISADINTALLKNMDNVDRIEVLKGSASTLYGSDAKGGVINIITKTTISSAPLIFRALLLS